MKEVPVAGESPILRVLVDDLLVASPWLQLRGDQLEVDWAAAWPAGLSALGLKADPEVVLRAAAALWPAVPLGWLEAGRRHHHRDKPREHTVPGTTQPLAPVVQATLATLSTAADELGEALATIRETKRLAGWAGEAVLRGERTVKRLRALAGITGFKTNVGLSFDLGARLTVARGDIAALLSGKEEAGSMYSWREATPERRAELWRRTRAMLGTRLDLLGALTEAPSGGADPGLRSSMVTRLAVLEARLFSCLASGVHPLRYGRGLDFLTADGCPLEAASHLWSVTTTYGRSPLPRNPYQTLYEDLRTALPNWADLRSFVGDKKLNRLLEVTEAASSSALQAVSVEIRQPWAGAEQESVAHDLQACFDWILQGTPLLTLLVAGFLSTYREGGDNGRFGLCLSPWLAANALAESMLGARPLRHGVSEPAAEPSESKEDDLTTMEPGQASLHGRSLWDLALAHR